MFCGINPGFRSAAAAAHFANPRNDFWRLLADSGLTPRLYTPEEQWTMPHLGYGLTNAAYRTTKGSNDLRRADFEGSAERLGRLAEELRPRMLAFVGKAAYAGVFRERPALGLQELRSARRGSSFSPRPRPPTPRCPTTSACAGSVRFVTTSGLIRRA